MYSIKSLIVFALSASSINSMVCPQEPAPAPVQTGPAVPESTIVTTLPVAEEPEQQQQQQQQQQQTAPGTSPAISDDALIKFLTENQSLEKENSISLDDPNIQPPNGREPISAVDKCKELANEKESSFGGIFVCVDLMHFYRCSKGKVVINEVKPVKSTNLVKSCIADLPNGKGGFCTGGFGENPCAVDAAAAVKASKTAKFFIAPKEGDGVKTGSL